MQLGIEIPGPFFQSWIPVGLRICRYIKLMRAKTTTFITPPLRCFLAHESM